MYDGKQVLRFVNNYKSKGLYNLGNEMIKRIGTGNYDKTRTQFNVHYKDIKEKNLYQEVKSILESRNIEYLHKSKTNMLNGVTFTSGPEFFQALGMPFRNSFRKYQSGDKEGQDIMVPDIKSKDDIPDEVTRYFDCCMDFLKDLVGEENIVMAQVHYDEDTPHLQAYFLPIVDTVKRKCYKRDEKGNLVKETVINNGKEKSVPILLRDDEGNIVYETVHGKFLNNDQFWKDLGGRNSFSTLQDSFNKFITEQGFQLDRGNIGSNKVHQTKLQYKVNELRTESMKLWNQISDYNNELADTKKLLSSNIDSDNIPVKKGITGYSNKDVEKLIEYTLNLEKINDINNHELKVKDNKISELSMENYKYKNNKELISSKQYNHKQDLRLKTKDNEIDSWRKAFFTMCDAFDVMLKRKPISRNANDYVLMAESIKATKRLNKEMEEAAKEFRKLFNNDDYQL